MKPPTMRIYPFDYIVLGYSVLMTTLILVFGHPLTDYFDELAFYVATALLAIVIPRVIPENGGPWRRFFRFLYPAMLFWPFYRMTQGTIHLIFGTFFDTNLSAFEVSVLGFEPSLVIDSHGPSLLYTEILSLCYFSYYFIIPGFLLPVFLRRDYRVLKEAIAAICITFFASYLLFALYPIEGPRWHFAQQYQHTLQGPVFRPLVDYVMNANAVHGGCMPSSHTAVALVILIFCFRYYRPWGWLLLPFVVGLAVGTVWGRFHYVSDVIVGVAIGLIADWVVRKYHDRWIHRDDVIVKRNMIPTAHVS